MGGAPLCGLVQSPPKEYGPDGGERPDGELAEAMVEHFGSFEGFHGQLSAATTLVQGSATHVASYQTLATTGGMTAGAAAPWPVTATSDHCRVIVETLLLSERGGVLHFRATRRPLRDGEHPDDVARRLSKLTAYTPGGLLHSTS